MFDELLKAVKRLEQPQQISVDIATEPDADGYIDKECPAERCRFTFKVHVEDWRACVRDEEMFCPFCGHSAPAQQWFTTEQVEWAEQAAFTQITNQVDDAMRRDAANWNRRQPHNAFVSITLHVEDHPREVLLPVAATTPMRLKISCQACRCRYSVIGSAYFCPACGHNAADQVFDQSLVTISGALDAVPTIKAGIGDRDTAENTVRLLVENGLLQAVAAFQRLAEALFLSHPNAQHTRRNAFQNLDEGSALWQAAFGRVYSAHLSSAELATLGRYFQQRHLLAHREGLVDGDYLARTGDTTYRPGQRLVIGEHQVRECVALIKKLADGLRADAEKTLP